MRARAVTLTDTTVSGNTDRGVHASGDVTLTNSTVSGNTEGGVSAQNVTLIDSTVDGNSTSGFRYEEAVFNLLRTVRETHTTYDLSGTKS